MLFYAINDGHPYMFARVANRFGHFGANRVYVNSAGMAVLCADNVELTTIVVDVHTPKGDVPAGATSQYNPRFFGSDSAAVVAAQGQWAAAVSAAGFTEAR